MANIYNWIIKIIEIVLPVTIAIIGWYKINSLNQKNIKEEKLIIIKIEAYNSIREEMVDLIKTYSQLYFFLNNTSNMLKEYQGDSITDTLNKKEILMDFKKEHFKTLMANCMRKFERFFSVWESQEIIFTPLVNKKELFLLERKKHKNKRANVHKDYISFVGNQKVFENDDKLKNVLIDEIKDLADVTLNLGKILEDVNYDMQKYVYSDLLNVDNVN